MSPHTRKPWKPKTAAEQRAERDIKVAKLMKYQYKRTFRYKKILDQVKADEEHRGQFAVIAVFREGTKTENYKKARKDATELQFWFKDIVPMEDWQLSYTKIPDTWGDYQIRVAYYGTFRSEAQMRKAREERRALTLRERRQLRQPLQG